MRWKATDAAGVASWQVALNGQVVRSVAAGATARLKVRIARPGRNHWRVSGYDSRSGRVVSATRSSHAAQA